MFGMVEHFFVHKMGLPQRRDDDLNDRLNRLYCPLLLVLFAVIVMTKHYVGEPVTCWVPQEFSESWEDYTNKYCWVTNTYYVPETEKDVPDEHEPKEYINYYQWVPLILLIQSILFHMPCMVWRFLSHQGGLDIDMVVKSAEAMHHPTYHQDRKVHKIFIIDTFIEHFFTNDKYKRSRCQKLTLLLRRLTIMYGKSGRNYVTFVFIFTKFLYILNALGQIFVLSIVIGKNFPEVCWQFMNPWVSGEWSKQAMAIFPRVTLCDLSVRALNNIQRHTVQCVLPVNMFHEKIYIFIWYMLAVMVVVNTLSLLVWIARSIFFHSKLEYLKSILKDNSKHNDKKKKLLNTMINKHLQGDGVLLLRLLGINLNKVMVREILQELVHFMECAEKSIRPENLTGARSTDQMLPENEEFNSYSVRAKLRKHSDV